MKMVSINGGTCKLGSKDEPDNQRHRVWVDDYALSDVPITEQDWYEVMGGEVPAPGHEDYPKVQVSWFEAVEYCNTLSAKEGLVNVYIIAGVGDKRRVYTSDEANGYRLPTEAEWEYAATEGKGIKGTKYSGSDDPDEVAVYRRSEMCAVRAKKPNAFGLYDMSGLVWEWCKDTYRAFTKKGKD
jgi:sulfatase modifying factor 1